MPKTTTTKAPTPADAEKQAQLDPPTDAERMAVLQAEITALKVQLEATENMCNAAAERFERAEATVSLLNPFDPQTRIDLRAVRVAIEEAIPSSRYLSGNDVEGCKRIKEAIDKILELPEPPIETEE